MSALSKFQATDAPNAGHRWDYMAKLLTSGIGLSADARLLLFVLLTHNGDERRVNPGLRRLAEMCGMSPGRCMAARDELIAIGLIACTLGSGTRSSEYRLVDLDAWFAEWVAARTSVRNSRSSVPDSRSSVHPVGTKPTEPSESKKDDRPVLKIVPTSGWAALLHHASKQTRTLWLDQVESVFQNGNELVLKVPGSLYVQRIGAMLAKGGELHELARGLGIDPDRVTIKGPAHGAARTNPDTVPLNAKDQNEFADRLAEKTDTVITAPVFDGNTVSLAAYRTRLQPPPDATSHSRQGNPPDTEDPDGS